MGLSEHRIENLLFLLSAASLPMGCAVGSDIADTLFPGTGFGDGGDDEVEDEDDGGDDDDDGESTEGDTSGASMTGVNSDPDASTSNGDVTDSDPTSPPTTSPTTLDPSAGSTAGGSTFGGTTYVPPVGTGGDATCYDYAYLMSYCNYGTPAYYYLYEPICEYYQGLALSYGAACYAAFGVFLDCISALDCVGLSMVGMGSSCDDEQQAYFNAC